MIASSLIASLVYLLFSLVIPLGAVLGLTYINRDSKGRLAVTYGEASQIYAGGLGVMLHEASHLVMAVLFGHQITDAKLLVMPWNIEENHGALGYVNHRWNTLSMYQNLGNALIGTAPIYGCTAGLIGLMYVFVPNVFELVHNIEHIIMRNPQTIDVAAIWQVFSHFSVGELSISNIICILFGLFFQQMLALVVLT